MFRSDVFLSWGGRGRKRERRAIVRGLKIIVYISLYIYIERERNYRLTIGRISMEEERLRIE